MHDVVKRRLAPLRKDPKVFPGEADGILDDAQIWSSMLNLFGEKAAVAIMVTGDEEDNGGGEEEEDGDGSAGRRRRLRGRRACWPPAKKKKMELPPAATEVAPPLGSGSSSAGTGTRELRRRKRPPPTPAPSAALRRRSSRRRSVGEGGGPQEEELEKVKRENSQLSQDLKTAMAEKEQCRDTYDRARAALRQINMHPELPPAADGDSGDSACALFGRVVDRLELIVSTLPDRFLESARGVAQDTAELVLGHCLRLHPQVDLQRIVKAVVEEEEDLPPPETNEAQARVLEAARQIADQCVQVDEPFGDDGEEDTSAGNGGQGGAGSSSAAEE